MALEESSVLRRCALCPFSSEKGAQAHPIRSTGLSFTHRYVHYAHMETLPYNCHIGDLENLLAF